MNWSKQGTFDKWSLADAHVDPMISPQVGLCLLMCSFHLFQLRRFLNLGGPGYHARVYGYHTRVYKGA